MGLNLGPTARIPQMSTPSTEVTRLLRAWTDGEPEALDQLIPLVFDDVRALAQKALSHESPNHTLQPTQHQQPG